jgi:hypothetical protein
MTAGFKPIPNWEGEYSLNPDGEVRAEERTITRRDGVRITRKQRMRKVREWPNRRRTVRLRRPGQQSTARVDQLLLELFGDPGSDDRPSLTRHSLANKCDGLTNNGDGQATQQAIPDGPPCTMVTTNYMPYDLRKRWGAFDP